MIIREHYFDIVDVPDNITEADRHLHIRIEKRLIDLGQNILIDDKQYKHIITNFLTLTDDFLEFEVNFKFQFYKPGN